MNQLVIDDFIRSYDDLNLLIEKRDLIAITKENKTFHNLTSLDGQLVERHRTYKEKSFSITFIVSHNNLSEYVRNITEILINAKTIHFTNDDEVFYKVLNIECEGIKLDGHTWGKMDVKFTIMPFSYIKRSFKTKTYTDFENIIELKKCGTAVAKPLIKIYGTGDIVLKINNKLITINNLPYDSRPLLIDSETLDSNYGFQLGTPYWRGDFPIFDKEVNTIEFISGNLTKLELIPRFAYL